MKKFAFLVHPRDIEDVSRRWWPAKLLPKKAIEFIGVNLKGRWGFTICSQFKVNK